MSPTEFEIGKIAEIVAGKVGANLDAKSLRRVIDQVVDNLKKTQGNVGIESVTCDTSARPAPPAGESPTYTPGGQQPLPPQQEMVPERGGLYEQIERTDASRIIVAAFGKNRPGIVAAITKILADLNCSIEDISQTIMQEFFSMIMIVDISGCSLEFAAVRDQIQATEAQLGMKVYVMHEDIFRYMHRI